MAFYIFERAGWISLLRLLVVRYELGRLMSAISPIASVASAAGISIQAETRRALESRHCQGAALSMGFPQITDDIGHDWLGRRLVWWPRGIPEGRLISLVSSRLGRALDQKSEWFRVLRAACAKLDPRRNVMLSVIGTTTAPFIRRSGRLFGQRVLEVIASDGARQDLSSWFDDVAKLATDGRGDLSQAYLSPPVDAVEVIGGPRRMPLHDRAAVALGNQLLVLHLRRGGNIDSLVRTRLESAQWPVASVYLAMGSDQLVPKRAARQLMAHGAVGWLPSRDSCRGTATDESEPMFANVVNNEPAPIVAAPVARPWPYLTHCTRRSDGPWPDQDADEYLDELILGHPSCNRSALAAIARIVSSRRLIASGRTIRGGTPVVSLSEASLGELAKMRVFRPHRSRWDFEPYGICIRREWLEARGAKPVCYGDEETWRQLASEMRPFFQKNLAEGGRIDWSPEREWRHLGDLDLNTLPSDAAMVFAPSKSEAQHLAKLSPWPVAVLTQS